MKKGRVFSAKIAKNFLHFLSIHASMYAQRFISWHKHKNQTDTKRHRHLNVRIKWLRIICPRRKDKEETAFLRVWYTKQKHPRN
jgi:hypothetical protein